MIDLSQEEAGRRANLKQQIAPGHNELDDGLDAVANQINQINLNQQEAACRANQNQHVAPGQNELGGGVGAVVNPINANQEAAGHANLQVIFAEEEEFQDQVLNLELFRPIRQSIRNGVPIQNVSDLHTKRQQYINV